MPQERAFGAAVIAVLIGIVGFFTFLTGVLILITQAFSTSWGSSWVPSKSTFLGFVTANATILALVVIVLGLIYLGVAVGLWHQHFWALVLTFVVGLLYVIGEGSGLVYGFLYNGYQLTNVAVLGTILGVVVVAAVLAYLAAVRDDFI